MSFRSARTSRHLAVPFARNDLLFTMSDNTRRRTSHGRDEIAYANLFSLRTRFQRGRSETRLRQKASAGNLRGSKNGLSTESCEAAKVGGARRDRTDDLLLAKQALSQ